MSSSRFARATRFSAPEHIEVLAFDWGVVAMPPRPPVVDAAGAARTTGVTAFPGVEHHPAQGDARPGTEPAEAGDAAPAGAVDPAHLAALERDAFAKGYAQGERAGLEAGSTRAEAMLRRMAATLDELGTLRAAMIHATEQQMVQLALAIARRILRREATLDGDLVVAMARVALDRLGERTPATVRLNPEDLAGTGAQEGALGSSFVTVVADASLSRGQCKVESEFGFIDAGVEAQFEQIAHALVGETTPAPEMAVVPHAR